MHHNRFRCSVTTKTLESPDGGHLIDQYGNYSGLIGQMQRNRLDFANYMTRLSSLKGRPVGIGSAMMAADVAIISKTRESFFIQTGVLDALNNFTLETYLWILIVLIDVLIIMTIGQHMTGARSLVREVEDMLMHICYALVDQEHLANKQRPLQSVIWFTFNCAQLVVVFGYLCNFMSTDKIATVIPAQIDSLEDLLSPAFSDIKPMMSTDLFLFDYLKLSPKGSHLGKLFAKIEEDKMASFVELADDEVKLKLAAKQLDGLLNGTRSMSLMKFFVNTGVSIACMLDPEAANVFRMSRESYAQGILTSFYNRHVDHIFGKIVRHRSMPVFEMGTIKGFFDNGKLQVTETELYKRCSMGSLDCEQSFQHGTKKSFQFHKMALEVLHQLLIVVIHCGLSLSMCVSPLICHATWALSSTSGNLNNSNMTEHTTRSSRSMRYTGLILIRAISRLNKPT
ncbi:hypothetical protein HDE_02482 [Halotydeus destructor]|nr:hypothetical protein HDE_02482 [Halotydeus destructor]